MTERGTQLARAGALNLHGLLAHWGEVTGEAWVTCCSDGRSRSTPAAVWSDDCAPLTSVASSHSATSIGTGPSAAIASPSMR
jgi:hypothetical protein